MNREQAVIPDGFVLNSETVRHYLDQQGLLAASTKSAVRELGGGISNTVLLIEWPLEDSRDTTIATHRWIVKQSLAKLRVKDDWSADRSRILREAASIRDLRHVLGDSVPDVIYIDHKNFLFIMGAAPIGSLAWKECLLAGRSDPSVPHEAGLLLGKIITASKTEPKFATLYSDRTIFDQLRIDPYYRTTACRHPDVASTIHKLIEDSGSIRTSLVHGDYSPKNILVRNGRILLIDFEVVHWGDPAFDSAFLLNHIYLKALYRPFYKNLYLDIVEIFWAALRTTFGPCGIAEFERMTVRHIGALMLARIDGKSPVEYIRDDEIKERARHVAKRILIEEPQDLKQIAELVAEAIQ
jgi:5-methylthioribose kinase